METSATNTDNAITQTGCAGRLFGVDTKTTVEMHARANPMLIHLVTLCKRGRKAKSIATTASPQAPMK